MLKKPSRNKVKKAVKKFIESMVWMFDYQNFDRTILFREKDEDNLAAGVTIDKEYQRVTIFIYPCFFDNTIDSQRQYLLHEFCHTYTDILKKKASNLLNGKLETEESIRFSNEEATSRITNTLDALLQGKLGYARKAYAQFIETLSPPVNKKRKRRARHGRV